MKLPELFASRTAAVAVATIRSARRASAIERKRRMQSVAVRIARLIAFAGLLLDCFDEVAGIVCFADRGSCSGNDPFGAARLGNRAKTANAIGGGEDCATDCIRRSFARLL